jgi:DNA uptake protein ComE-like DNA-binding protein
MKFIQKWDSRNQRRGPRQSRAGARSRINAEIADLARLQGELSAARARYESEIADLERRTEEARRAAPKQTPPNGRAKASPAGKTGAKRNRSRSRRPPTKGKTPQISLKDAGAADLRALGLSPTQAAQILRQRREGSLTSPAALDQVSGIPKSQLAQLKRSLKD